MEPGTRLPRPPIVEALIDVRVDPRPDVDVDQLAAVHEVFGKDAFPTVNKQVMNTIQLGDSPAGMISSSVPTGLLFRSADNTQVLQVQRDGFAFSRLVPYTSWEDVVANARLRWRQYAAIARPRSIKRIAARYINRIPLPQPVVNFAEWIPKFPDVPPGLPQGIAQMFLRLVVPIPSQEGIIVNVTQALEPYVAESSVVTVVFDIDVYRVGAWQPDGDEVWTDVERLRSIKNAFFFEYLSTRTLELFK